MVGLCLHFQMFRLHQTLENENILNRKNNPKTQTPSSGLHFRQTKVTKSISKPTRINLALNRSTSFDCSYPNHAKKLPWPPTASHLSTKKPPRDFLCLYKMGKREWWESRWTWERWAPRWLRSSSLWERELDSDWEKRTWEWEGELLWETSVKCFTLDSSVKYFMLGRLNFTIWL